MRVVSYNVKSCLLSGIEPVAEAISATAPDVVGLQEVDQRTLRSGGLDQAEELARRTGLGYAAFAEATPWQGGGSYGVALLSRYPLQQPRRWPLYVPTEADVHESLREPRVLFSATIHPWDTIPLRLFVTHFGLAPSQRRIQARETAAAAQQAETGALPILLGDLNASPCAEELAPLIAVLTDAHAAVAEDRRGTFPAGVPLAQATITDYVLLSKELTVDHAEVVPDPGASDHNLCLAETSEPLASRQK